MVIKPGKPSIRVSHPEVAAQLHPTKNNGLTAEQIVAGSRKKYWWVCPEGPDHEWNAFVSNRTLNGSGCPCCAGKQLSVTNSLTNYTDVAAQLHPTKNEGVTLDQIIAGSNKKYWWKCPEGPHHEWLTTPGSRTGVETFLRLARRSDCYACRKVDKLTNDHTVPRARGGSHGPENWSPICKKCNPSKNDMDLIEWWAYQGRTLDTLDNDVLVVYVRSMYTVLASEESLDTPAPGTLCFVLAQFAASLPTQAHTDAFNGISAAALQQMTPLPVGAK